MGGVIRRAKNAAPSPAPATVTVDYVDYVNGGPSAGPYHANTTMPNGFVFNLQVGSSVMFASPAPEPQNSGVWVVSSIAGDGTVTFSRRADFALGTTHYSNATVLANNTLMGQQQWTMHVEVLGQSGDAVSGALDNSTVGIYLTPVGIASVISSTLNVTPDFEGGVQVDLPPSLSGLLINKGPVGTGTVTFNQSDSEYQKLTVTGNLSVAFSGWPAAGTVGKMEIEAVNWGSATVSFSTTINWMLPNGTTTTSLSTYFSALGRSGFPSSGTALIYLRTSDGGTTIMGRVA